MNEFSHFLLKDTLSNDDILLILEEIGRNGDAILIKNDGIRERNNYTAVIIMATPPNNSFRCDRSSLSEALKFVLGKYIEAAPARRSQY